MTEWVPSNRDLNRSRVVRFTLAERVQHDVLIVTMVVLMITGLPLLIPGLGTGAGPSAFTIRTFLHRFSGAVMIGLAVFHSSWILFTRRGRRDIGRMTPTLQDLKDLVHHVKYQLGKVDEPPPYDTFDPFEKFEYLSVVWGSVVMIVTGLMMWFIEMTLTIFPLWIYDLVVLIHGYEAVLAFTAIIILHLYNVHLKPGVYPMSRVWLDGKVTLREMKEHHPRQYARWLEQERARRAAQPPVSVESDGKGDPTS